MRAGRCLHEGDLVQPGLLPHVGGARAPDNSCSALQGGHLTGCPHPLTSPRPHGSCHPATTPTPPHPSHLWAPVFQQEHFRQLGDCTCSPNHSSSRPQSRRQTS